MPPAVKSAFASALGLDGSEAIEDTKTIPAETISKVLSELLVESSSGHDLATPIMQGKVRRLWQELGAGPSASARAPPSQARLATTYLTYLNKHVVCSVSGAKQFLGKSFTAQFGLSSASCLGQQAMNQLHGPTSTT